MSQRLMLMALTQQTSASDSEWAALDGRLNAPAGSANFPNALDGYGFQPPWQVAGVDYHVGIDRTLYPTNGDLKDPASDTLPAGCSRNVGAKEFYIDGTGAVASGVVVDGWDFSGGWAVHIYDTTSPTISNCFFDYQGGCFGINSAQSVSAEAVGAYIKNCEFDQTQSPVAWVSPILILSNSSDDTNKHIIEYTHFKNSQSEHFQIHDGLSTGHADEINYINRFNLFENAGVAAPVGAHGDWTHTWGSNITGSVNKFNFYYQTLDDALAATRGIVDISETSRADSCIITNNTMVVLDTAAVQQFVANIGAMIQTLAVIHDNYCNVSQVNPYSWQLDPFSTGTPYPANAGQADIASNINMTTGGTIT